MYEDLIAIALTSIVVGIVWYVSYVKLDGYLFGPHQDWWNLLRRKIVPTIDTLIRENTSLWGAVNPARDVEYVCTIDADSDLPTSLYDKGYERSPILSGLKYRLTTDSLGKEFEDHVDAYEESDYETFTDFIEEHGEYESASWAWRKHPLAMWQNHLFYFENEDGTIDCYAHWEYASTCPIPPIPYWHYIAKDLDVDEGRQRLLNDLEDTDVTIIEISDDLTDRVAAD